MTFILWYLIAGGLLISIALVSSVLKRLPLSTSLLYLGVGFALGPTAAGLIHVDPLTAAPLLERLTEVAVIISLFTAGLKLSLPLSDRQWQVPLRLCSVSMLLTVGAITLIGVYLLGLPVGAAVLLGAVLAPTDPVLASDVQVEDPTDRDRLRFGLTGEAGLNDGTAFPFVMLGLGLLGLHPLGSGGVRWVAIDLIWAVAGGLGIGALLGALISRLVLYLRREHREAVGLDEFLTLGLIALSYGTALLLHAYGFLAVFAAGLALRRVERRESPADSAPTPNIKASAAAADEEEIATDRANAPAYMAQAVLGFTEQLERIAEVAVVVLLGGLLTVYGVPSAAYWFVPLLLLVVRPLSVAIGLIGSGTPVTEQALIGWFGIRGIGSVYYLAYAMAHGVPDESARLLTSLTLVTVATSIVVHGTSVTPLMRRYHKDEDSGAGSEDQTPRS